MQTIGNALKQYDGTAPGADTLRFWLATGVIVYHSFGMTGNVIPGVPDHAAAEFGKVILVPMFIALSGFLLAASATRTDLRRFVMNRVLRSSGSDRAFASHGLRDRAHVHDAALGGVLLGRSFLALPSRGGLLDFVQATRCVRESSGVGSRQSIALVHSG